MEIFNCVRVILDRPKARILGVDYEARKYEETTISRAEGVGKIATIRGNFSENYTQPYTCILTFYFWRGDYCVTFLSVVSLQIIYSTNNKNVVSTCLQERSVKNEFQKRCKVNHSIIV